MAKSNLFVRCPKFKTECDIDTCPRFLSNIEVITGSDGNRTANGFCFERGTRYITNVPQKYFCNRQQTAAWRYMENDARNEVTHLERIRKLIDDNYVFVVREPTDGTEIDANVILIDTIASALESEVKRIDSGKISRPTVACTWQKVLPEVLTFPDDEAVYYIENNPEEHPEAFEHQLPNGEKVLINFLTKPHALKPHLDRVKNLTRLYIEKALMLSRTHDSASKELWARALGFFLRVNNGWQLPESRALLNEMTSTVIEAATCLSVDLSLPDKSRSNQDYKSPDTELLIRTIKKETKDNADRVIAECGRPTYEFNGTDVFEDKFAAESYVYEVGKAIKKEKPNLCGRYAVAEYIMNNVKQDEPFYEECIRIRELANKYKWTKITTIRQKLQGQHRTKQSTVKRRTQIERKKKLITHSLAPISKGKRKNKGNGR